MFGIWAKALFVYLAVSFVLTLSCTEGFKVMNLFQCFGTKSSGTGKFGCNFRGDKYAWNTNTPIWSTQNHTPADIYFETSTQSDSFIESVQEAFVETLIRNPLSNVDPFLRFIQAYKNQRKYKLEPFFNNYHVAFQKNVPHTPEDPVSLLIEINRRLSENQESAKGKLYIVSAYVNPSDNLIEDVKKSIQNTGLDFEKKAETELSKDQYQRHVAGIIKIQTPNGEGIIVLDPGYMNGEERVYPYSAVLMKPKWETAKLELNEVPVFGLKRDEIVDSYLGKKFALVSIKHSKCRCLASEYKVLYLQYKPFCSFMDSTIKGNLLGPKLGIMTFGPYFGTLVSAPYLSFKVSIGPVELGNYTCRYYYLTYESIQDPVGMKNDAKLGEGWHLKSKLETIWPVVFQDYDLNQEIYALREKLNQKPLAFKTCNH